MLDQAPEFKILLDLSEEQIAAISNPVIAQSIIRVRDGRVYIEPGYDGVFGKIQIYTSKEREQISKKPKQSSLF
jgi:PHP family Zn ribbon phosphoesterase